MGNFKKHLLMAVGMAGLMAQNNELETAGKPSRIKSDGEIHNSLHQSRKQRKTRKNRRRIASKMRAYNRNH